jgi:hypothetical protein
MHQATSSRNGKPSSTTTYDPSTHQLDRVLDDVGELDPEVEALVPEPVLDGEPGVPDAGVRPEVGPVADHAQRREDGRRERPPVAVVPDREPRGHGRRDDEADAVRARGGGRRGHQAGEQPLPPGQEQQAGGAEHDQQWVREEDREHRAAGQDGEEHGRAERRPLGQHLAGRQVDEQDRGRTEQQVDDHAGGDRVGPGDGRDAPHEQRVEREERAGGQVLAPVRRDEGRVPVLHDRPVVGPVPGGEGPRPGDVEAELHQGDGQRRPDVDGGVDRQQEQRPAAQAGLGGRRLPGDRPPVRRLHGRGRHGGERRRRGPLGHRLLGRRAGRDGGRLRGQGWVMRERYSCPPAVRAGTGEPCSGRDGGHPGEPPGPPGPFVEWPA